MPTRLTPLDIRRFPAHIFDMDGTLLNSEPLHLKALMSIIKEYKLECEMDEMALAKLCVGKADEDVFLELAPEWSQDKALEAVGLKNQKILEIIEQTNRKELQQLLTPGIQDYLQLLNKLKRRCFLLTASEQCLVPPLMEKVGLIEFFHDVQTRNHSFRTKPSSSPYLSLMRKYQLTTQEVVIYEDSPTGLSAAIETGAHIIHISAHCDDDVLYNFKHLQQSDNFKWLLIS